MVKVTAANPNVKSQEEMRLIPVLSPRLTGVSAGLALG
jgi:hypothetical protein